LQPWFIANALFLAALVFSGSEKEALDCCRLIVVAIYFWSGVHKMNTSFVNALFPSLVSSFATPRLAMPIHILGSIVPYLEMGMGLALLFPRTRRAGVIVIVGTHISLLAVLGPWALGWNVVVWPWNFKLMFLAPFLFWQSKVPALVLLRPGRSVARWFLFTVLLVLPPMSLVELTDTSLSFDLYSGDPLIGSVVVSPDAWGRLDSGPRAVAERFGDGYIIRFSDWSLSALNVPSYPAARVLRRVAQSFCNVHQKDNDVIFLMEKPARWFYRSGWHKIESAQELCSGAELQSRGLMPPKAELSENTVARVPIAW
jgi:hypothetical protein